MKIRETAQRQNAGSFGWSECERITEIQQGQEVPAQAQPVADDTPVCDWRPITVSPTAAPAPAPAPAAPTTPAPEAS